MIIPLIHALYDPRASLPQDVTFYEKALEDIAYFGVASQVYFLIQQQGRGSQVPLFFQERLKQEYNETLYLNLFIKNQTDRLLKKFEELGISVIPLKGVYLAEKYFGHLGARGTTDIDVLVQKHDLERAIQCVKSLGYTNEQESTMSHFHWSLSKPLPHCSVPLTVELHWDFLIEKTSNLNMDEFWGEALPMASFQYVKELSVYHSFYMICLHGWSHYMNSPKYFIDIIQILQARHDQIDFNRLLEDAAAHKTLRRMIRTLLIVYRYFPHLSEIKELPLRLPLRSKLNFEGAYRGRSRRNFKQFVSKVYDKFFNFDSLGHSWAALVQFVCNLGKMMFSSEIKKF
ncbi:nucleotidyltransferase family protein [Paenibacillus sp. CGMCC 1.16610]|uniref:Nucleotidyltransferase family protein n=1 Tax=Paenibacillus anseongense TaxID=2682845 RepID=A0ABW9U7P1_9BACL|nr:MULTISPECIES: nucleotidyltransferase family protein [Paenibacillus]MBA2943327.1 nucleotidyltransferase family protein [Paenibacillus sp. CGMCC 1.16610]MVQ33825.1 hypothetical protein [Paenibacillus anseongense]